jgi:hypothetical protein
MSRERSWKEMNVSAQNSTPFSEHPEKVGEVLARLGRLSMERPPNRWDNTIERLLNGLREPHLFIGTGVEDRTPWLLDRTLLRTHAHIMGGTGSGKTSLAIVPLAAQLIAHADASIVIIDLKGDRAMFWGSFLEAERAGLPFKWFTIDPGCASFVFNPFTQRHNQERTVNARAQSLLLAMGLYYGDAYGKSFFQSISLDTLTAFLSKYSDIRSFADLARYAEEPGTYVATGTDQENSQHLRTLLRQMGSIAPLNGNERTTPELPRQVLAEAIDMADVLTRKQVVYFSLPSLEEELTAKAIGKLALYALVSAAQVIGRWRKTVPCYVFLDEFQQMCAENIRIVLEMARSKDIFLLLSHQTRDQLKTVDYDITSTVESCTTFKLVFEASSLQDLKDMEAYSGEVRSHQLSWTQLADTGLATAGDDAFSLSSVYPRLLGEALTTTVNEHKEPRILRNEILAYSAHPLRALVRSRQDGGLTQYAGQWSPIECDFSISKQEYEARMATPWPSEHPSCVVVTADKGNHEPVKPPINARLPGAKPPHGVDDALANRLREAQVAVNGLRERKQ